MVKRYRVLFEARSPVLLGGETAERIVRDTRDWIPGAVWRGAVAEVLLRREGCYRDWNRDAGRICPSCDRRERCPASRLLAEARFLPLYPASSAAGEGDLTEVSGADDSVALPALLSGLVCKVDRSHPLQDRLQAELRRCLVGSPDGAGGDRVSLQPGCEWAVARQGLARCRHPGCGARLERLRGVLEQRGHGPTAVFRPVRTRKRAEVKVGLSRRSGRAEEEVLFALRPLAGLSLFVGSLVAPEDISAWLERELSDVEVRMGAAKSRGLGAGRLRLSPAVARDDLEERLERFQPRLKGCLLDSGNIYFSLDLLSPALLFDDRGASACCLSPEVLVRYCEGEVAEVLRRAEVVPLRYAEQTPLGGWSQTWGMPKPVWFAIAPGSSFVFRIAATYRSALLDVLRHLENVGVGELRSQGFGEVAVCHWFHISAGGDEVCA